MTSNAELETRLHALIDHHLRLGAVPAIEDAVADRPDLAVPLRALFNQYLAISGWLDEGLPTAPAEVARSAPPLIPGFRVVERLGGGGMGEVYKLHDLQLDRVVAGKVLKPDASARVRIADAVREAKALALSSDPRIVQVFDLKSDIDPPVIIMEFVDGFELGRIGPSLELRQRVSVLRDVGDAIAGTHARGLQHRDLKPSNVMLDGRLKPKILDFGLSAGDPRAGHFRGTLHYLAPEQLDPTQPIDARTDVYALGVMLYELIAGRVPYPGESATEVIKAIRAGQPPLPVEIRPDVPEPLQAIALKAMERDPAQRYQSARELCDDLDRYLEGRPILARPSAYASTLAARAGAHLDQIAEWLRLRLIYPHEAQALTAAYGRLDAREDDWIVAGRTLSYSQIALYLGAFFLFAGALFYFSAHRFYGAIAGVSGPLLVLGVPVVGLSAAGRWLYAREQQAVAVAFYLAGAMLLPLLLLIVLAESHVWTIPADAPGQLFSDGSISNRQLQVTIGVAALWAGWLALRTTTSALSTACTAFVGIFALSVLADFGLRDWVEHDRFDAVALHLAPLALVYAIAALALERSRRRYFATPLFLGAALTGALALDLLALDGKLLHLAGLSLQSVQPAGVTSATRLDTLTALTLNGVLFYLAATWIDRAGTPAMRAAAFVLFTIAPFSMLEPLAYLSETAEYWAKVDWVYLGLAVTIALVSHHRQRRSFYYAGLLNSGVALYLIAERRHWFDKPSWAIVVVVVGLAGLAAGFLIDAAERRRAS